MNLPFFARRSVGRPSRASRGGASGFRSGRTGGAERLEPRIALAADVAVSLPGIQSWYTPGNELVTTLVARNVGDATAAGVTVSSGQPSQLTRQTWTAVYSGGATGPAVGAGPIAAPISLPAGGSATFTIVGLVSDTATGSLTVSASGAISGGDANPANDSATATLGSAPRFVAISDDLGASSSARVSLVAPTTGAVQRSFVAYEVGFRGGVQTVVADLDGDGRMEIVTAPGAGRVGEIRVFSAEGVELPGRRLQPFGPQWRGGVNVAVGDVDGDGRVDLVAAKARGDGAVRIFRGQTGGFESTAFRGIRPFGPNFLGGSNVAVADLGRAGGGSPDGRAEVIVGSGPTALATVRVYDVSSATPVVLDTIRPFGGRFTGGVSVTTARIGIDPTPDIVVAAGHRGRGGVEGYDGTVGAAANPRLFAFAAFPAVAGSAATHAAAVDTDGDGRANAILATMAGQGVRTFSTAGQATGTLGGFGAGSRLVAAPIGRPSPLVTTASGLQYRDLAVGTGAAPSSDSARVTVNYEGWLLNGTRFDGNNGSSFALNGVIRGWTEGLRSMKVGGRRQLIIPADLGYGATGTGSIPPNATLVFDVELLSTT